MVVLEKYTVDDIKELVKPLLKKYSAKGAILFGSYARGEATEESDIDIVVLGGKDFDPTDVFCIAVDYRIKSEQSAHHKYERYYPDTLAEKVFNDLLGFRSLCDSYSDILALSKEKNFRVADMSMGKSNDDGYRGIHVYFQIDHYHYPIEIQYNTYYDRQLNNWLHSFLYKKGYDNSVGKIMRKEYELGNIKSDIDFEEVLKDVLSRS